MQLSFNELIRFLRAAKLGTYAGQGNNAALPALPDSKQLEYRDGEFFYRDVYVGSVRFVGQEIVYLADRAIWSMSYAGGLSKAIPTDSANPIYSFLRQALLNAPQELPLRGPGTFEAGGLLYTCITDGSLEWFHGREAITRDGIVLYELFFTGGSLV
ncbi:MAG: DUF5680 domain-containing protein [Candidatus Ozemobacteraceae bacterium]